MIRTAMLSESERIDLAHAIAESGLVVGLINPLDCIHRFEDGEQCGGKRNDVIHNERGHSVGYHPFISINNVLVDLFDEWLERRRTPNAHGFTKRNADGNHDLRFA